VGVTSFRDGALSAPLDTGVFCGDQARELQAFLGGMAAYEIAEFGHHSDRPCTLHAAQGLRGFDHGGEAPGVDVLLKFLAQAVKTLGVFVEGTDVCLKDHVLSRARTDDLREPSEMGWVPGGPARVAASVAEQEGFEAELGGFEITEGIFARPAEIPKSFAFLLGNIDRGEITGAPQAGQWHRVTAVGFDAVAGLFGNEGGRNGPADLACFRQIKTRCWALDGSLQTR
jgi:hypothetical protein